jgi:tetratricopeptide (TPR) repeat protein
MQAEKAAVISGRKEWALRSRFLMGRFYFEIGLYKDALNVFTSLMENWKDDPASKQYLFLSNWSNRAKLYLADKTNETPVFNGGDGKIFEIEAAYLFGDYKKTIALADAMIASQTDMSFHFLEQPDWTSGFAQCELLLYSKKDYWYRMVTVWRSLALCKVDKTRANEAVHIMQQIMRDERMADIDPNASFYFFANFLLLDETGANEVDRNTAISMAFKRLQRRASRIDDIETRRTYLASQYWNKILFATAKEYKLI